MALVDESRDFIYIHIFKTAGNSVRDVLPKDFSYELHGVHVELKDVHNHFISKSKEDFYRESFKFTFVRNPYDWMVSLYHYIKRSKGHNYNEEVNKLTFPRFVRYYIEELMNLSRPYGSNKYLTQYDFILNKDGKEDIDFVGKTENIDEDMRVVLVNIGLEHAPFNSVPKKNVSGNREVDFMGYYDSESLELMRKVFKKDFEIFGYDL